MPLLMPLIAICVIATYFLRTTWLFVPALINALANLWSLGVLWNFRGQPVSGNYERVVGAISMLTSLIGVVLLISSFFISSTVVRP